MIESSAKERLICVVARSFVSSLQFAETFKYYFLLFADHSELSLDDYVLSTGSLFLVVPFLSRLRLLRPDSTRLPADFFLPRSLPNLEAHPFIHNPLLKPGSSGLWDPSLVSEEEKKAPIGEGTSVQKAAVLLEKEMMEALMITR